MRVLLTFIFIFFIPPSACFALEPPPFTWEEFEILDDKIEALYKYREERKASEETKEPFKKSGRPLKLQSYEPNMLGYTKDRNDVDYMDFKLSLKYPIIHDGEYLGKNAWHRLPLPYIAFSGRFGQYITSRKSAPVIGKRFNPKVIFRYWLWDKDSYFDIAMAHESNGQRIDSAQAYQDLRDDFETSGENPDFARDYISRGWDYWDLVYKETFTRGEHKLRTYLNYKHFLKGGGVQEGPEEYNSWEGDDNGKKRKYVDGITIMAKYSNKFSEKWKGQKVALKYTTGVKEPFRYETVRFEFTHNILTVPVTLWVSDGYNSDLVDYYKSVRSWGIALELRNYLDEI